MMRPFFPVGRTDQAVPASEILGRGLLDGFAVAFRLFLGVEAFWFRDLAFDRVVLVGIFFVGVSRIACGNRFVHGDSSSCLQ